jgi:hypothetical protein
VNDKHPTNPSWNSNSNKALFLTGKPNKVHRAGLLSKFYENNLMNTLEWSLFVNDYMTQEIKQTILSHYTQDKFENFIKTCTRNPDNINLMMQTTSCHYGGFPYDVNLYSNTCLSIISETWWHNDFNPWITEKTWKAIANKHPFIVAGDFGHLDKMESLGFKTFKNFMLHPEYNSDTSRTESDRLNLIVENHKHFLNHVKENVSDINYCIEFNFQQFKKYSISNYLPYDGWFFFEKKI